MAPPVGIGALYWAAQENKLAAVRLLLTSGTDPNDEDEAGGCRAFGSPLEGAYSGGQVGLAVLLLAAVPTRSAPSSAAPLPRRKSPAWRPATPALGSAPLQ